MLPEAFAEHSLSRTADFQWHSRFKAGRVSAEDDKCWGQPSTSKTTENVEKTRELVHENRRRTIHELSDTVGISYGVCQILTENLNMVFHLVNEVRRLFTRLQNLPVYSEHKTNGGTEFCLRVSYWLSLPNKLDWTGAVRTGAQVSTCDLRFTLPLSCMIHAEPLTKVYLYDVNLHENRKWRYKFYKDLQHQISSKSADRSSIWNMRKWVQFMKIFSAKLRTNLQE
jgi:hypothetical protein